MEIHIIKPGDSNPSQTLVSQGGQILEWGNNIENQEGGLLPATIIDSVPIAQDFANGDQIGGSSLEMVLDFIPAGSQIIINFGGGAGASGIGTVSVRAQLEGRNMVKSGKPSNFSYVSGEQVVNQATVVEL